MLLKISPVFLVLFLCACFQSQVAATPPAAPVLDWRPLPVDDADRPQYAAWYDFIKLGEKRFRLPSSNTVRDIRPVGDYYPRAPVTGQGLKLIVPRAFARPGDRWLEVFVELDAEIDLARNVRLDVSLHGSAGAEPLAADVIIPETRVGMLRVDLRRLKLPVAHLAVELSDEAGDLAQAQVLLAALEADSPLETGRRVAVSIDLPADIPDDQAVGLTFTVPFPAGALWSPDGLRLVTDHGREIPAQTEVLGLWGPDGAIQWLRFDCVAVAKDGLNLEFAAPASTGAGPELTVTEDDGRLILDTGAAVYELARGPSPITRISRDSGPVATADNMRGLYVVDQSGRLGQAAAAGQTMEVEAAGPVSACVRFEGDYQTALGETLARHITRVEVFAGRPEAQVTHTLVLTRDSNEIWFREIGWELAVAPGPAPRAMFGLSRSEHAQALVHNLKGKDASAWILQEEHLRFGAGSNRFHVAQSPGGERNILHAGEEMGDWAALVGDQAGLIAAVRDAALQHPKEFDLLPDRLIIRLFSNRAGEELDFRAATLAEKWHLPDTFQDEKVREVVAAYDSNAIGWAKTHAMLIAPLSPDGAEAQAARLAHLHAEQVYAHVDPWWIYETGALGGLHPKDVENYPGVEAVIDELITTFKSHLRGTAFYGFVDYNAGPSFNPRGSRGDLVRERRMSSTYQLRPDLWTLYARSGERAVRAFAEQTCRACADNYLAHWDGPGKVRGMFMEGANASPPLPHLGTGDLPFYWENGTVFNKQDNTSLNYIVYDYLLTGNRRSLDLVRQYGAGIKQAWNPRAVTSRKRKVMTFRAMLHAYNLTLDQDLRAITEATLSYVYDPEGVTGLTKNKELGATYKARCATRALIEGWHTFGIPPYYDMARRMAAHKWMRTMPLGSTTSPYAIAGNFLYRETGSLYYAVWLEYFLRHAPLRKVTASPFRAADITSGFALAQDAVARMSLDDRQVAARVTYRDDPARPVSLVVAKGAYDNLDVYIMTRGPQPAASNTWVRALSEPVLRSRDRSLITMHTSSDLPPKAYGRIDMRVNIPKEAPGEVYAVIPQHHGSQFVAAVLTRPEVLQLEPAGRRWTLPYAWTGQMQMVLHAPQGWQTLSVPAKVFFEVPDGVGEPRIGFDGPVDVFDPDGELFGSALSGWVELDDARPGLWSFAVDGASVAIEVENLPPYFAFDNPDNYFQPPMPEK